ncbi:hypothetical protein [Bacillus cereus]|nr:hypothetical protein [Bacillus cereus]
MDATEDAMKRRQQRGNNKGIDERSGKRKKKERHERGKEVEGGRFTQVSS